MLLRSFPLKCNHHSYSEKPERVSFDATMSYFQRDQRFELRCYRDHSPLDGNRLLYFVTATLFHFDATVISSKEQNLHV